MKVFGLRIGTDGANKGPKRDSVTSLQNEVKKVGLKAVLNAFENNPELALQLGFSILKMKPPDYGEQVFQKIVAENPELQYKLAETKINALLGGSGPKSLKDQIMELKDLMELVGSNNSGSMSGEIAQVVREGLQVFGQIAMNNPELRAKITSVAGQRELPEPKQESNEPKPKRHKAPEGLDYQDNMAVIRAYIDVLMKALADSSITPEHAASIALGTLNSIALETRKLDPKMSVANQINEVIQQTPHVLIMTLRNLVTFGGNNPQYRAIVDHLETEDGMEYLTKFHQAIHKILAEHNDENGEP